MLFWACKDNKDHLFIKVISITIDMKKSNSPKENSVGGHKPAWHEGCEYQIKLYRAINARPLRVIYPSVSIKPLSIAADNKVSGLCDGSITVCSPCL